MLEWLPYLIVTVIIMFGSFLGWLGSKLLPQIRKGTRVLDDFLGEPARPGIPARPGVIEALAGMRTDVDQVKKQVQNSHKTNFRDDLDKKASGADLARVEEKLTEHMRETAEWTPMLRDLHAQYSTRPTSETN
jgi:hypothetical protein